MSQIDKNTVSAENQLNGTEPIFFENAQGCGVRVLFVGNSITLHGYKPEIGWYGENYGMAASKKENDYVHIVMREILKRDPNAAFCICQASQWELNYADGQKVVEKLDLYKKIKDFKADIIVMRIVDNCPREKFDKAAFIKAYNAFISMKKKMLK